MKQMTSEKQRDQYGQTVSLVGILCNVLLAAGKLMAGLFSGMLSIVADAINNFSDATASIVSAVGFRLSAKPADDEHPFGHARYEYISGLVVAFLVMVAGVELLKSGIEKIVQPQEINHSALVYIVLVVSIAVKLFLYVLYHSVGKSIHSETVLAASVDSRNDIITTSAVLLSVIISQSTGWNLDGYMATAVALFILYSGAVMVKDTMKPLLGVSPDKETVASMHRKILSYQGVLGAHDLMIHDYGPGHCFASVDVEVAAEMRVSTCHAIVDRIEQDFLKDLKIHLVVHCDPVSHSKKETQIREFMDFHVHEVHPSLSIHDLRIYHDEKGMEMVFDCVVPDELRKQEDELMNRLKQLILEHYPDLRITIQVDHGFVSMYNES